MLILNMGKPTTLYPQREQGMFQLANQNGQTETFFIMIDLETGGMWLIYSC